MPRGNRLARLKDQQTPKAGGSDRWNHEEEHLGDSVAFDENESAFNHSSSQGSSKRLKKEPREMHHSGQMEQPDNNKAWENGPIGLPTRNDEKRKGKKWTLAIAVPGSVLDNAISHEMKTYIAGQVARTAAVFCVDEIVVYDDSSAQPQEDHQRDRKSQHESRRNVSLLAKILQFSECPMYLRSSFFPLHEDLKSVGLLNPLDAPHHLRSNEKCLYREGVVLPATRFHNKGTTLVNVGLRKEASIHSVLEPGLRVTVKFKDAEAEEDDVEFYEGDPVPNDEPSKNCGLYWGYQVRIADTFSSIFSQSPHEDGYDLCVGISSNGESDGMDQRELAPFHHAVIVFPGSLRSMEDVLNEDSKLEVKDPRDLFDLYVNPLTGSCGGGSHIRTEESLLISLSVFRPKLVSSGINNNNK